MKARIAVCLTLWCSLLPGSLSAWTGEYEDPIYGGSIFVCESTVDSQTYAQATFSRLGYMRGEVSGDEFSGEFWLQGWESIQGTFSLVLSGSSYSGSFTQQPGITYNISGSKISSSEPSDLECQRSDDYLLTSTEYYSSTGSYVHVGGDNGKGIVSNSIQESEAGAGTTYGTYQYVFYSTGVLAHGTEYSVSHLNGQVKTGRWSESGGYSGINMYVAKNSTHHYTSWWDVPRIAEFDFSLASNPDLEGHNLMEKVDAMSLPEDSRDPGEYVCLELFKEEDENRCFGYFFENDDDDDSVSSETLLAILSFSVLSFAGVVVLGVFMFIEIRKRNSSATTMSATETSNELHKNKL